MPANSKYTINFQPIGKRVLVDPGTTLLGAAQGAGIDIASICGGVGICNSCKVRLITGSLSALTLEEEAIFTEHELEAGFRLACQAYPQKDSTIEIPPEFTDCTPKVADRRSGSGD